jgi:hypothetical protein
MCNFIEDYLENPSSAISDAIRKASSKFSSVSFDEESIYNQISSPEFRLYEEMIFLASSEKQLAEPVRTRA